MSKLVRIGLMVSAFGVLQGVSSAGHVSVTVTIENLAPTNSISFAPLRLGFHRGEFDAFDAGEAPTAAIISVAEGGSGSDWFPAFAAADSTATLGSIGGALTPGSTASNTFVVDTSVNQYFTFASMVVPSNDFFIGNDDARQYRLFDDAGNLLINEIGQTASQIWDAGSEAFDPANAAFLVGGNNDLRTPQNGVVSFNFSELSGFNGFETAAGYIFDSQLSSSTPIYRISFSSRAVPEPASAGLAALGLAGLAVVRRFKKNAGPKPTD